MTTQCSPRMRPAATSPHRAALLTGAIALAAATTLVSLPHPATAASSAGCEGGGFKVSGAFGSIAAPGGTIPFNKAGSEISVIGKYVEFTVVSPTFGIRNWLFTGVANPLDITDGKKPWSGWRRRRTTAAAR